MENVDKNVSLQNLTPFTTDNQPSPEAKSAGWQRRRQGQAFMDAVMKYQAMTQKQFDKQVEKLKKKNSKATILELMAFKYASKSFNNDKFLLDWLNRHISLAPTNLEFENKGEPITKVTVEIIQPDGAKNASVNPVSEDSAGSAKV